MNTLNQLIIRRVTEVKQPKEGSWFGRHKILTGIMGLVLLIVVISAASGGSKDGVGNSSDKKSAQSESKKDNAKLSGIGEAVQDGKFEFTVSSIECGKTSVGTNQYLTKQAQGQFCLLNLSIKNIGTEAQTFDSSNVYLFDASDAKFSADSSASMYANPEGSTFLNQINPGNSVTGSVVFDLPTDKTPVVAELHDSMFSGGVKVQLQ